MADPNALETAVMELKPCPFCKDGGNPKVGEVSNPLSRVDWFSVTCFPGCEMRGAIARSESDAIEFWNRSAALDTEPVEPCEACGGDGYWSRRDPMSRAFERVPCEKCSPDTEPVGEVEPTEAVMVKARKLHPHGLLSKGVTCPTCSDIAQALIDAHAAGERSAFVEGSRYTNASDKAMFYWDAILNKPHKGPRFIDDAIAAGEAAAMGKVRKLVADEKLDAPKRPNTAPKVYWLGYRDALDAILAKLPKAT